MSGLNAVLARNTGSAPQSLGLQSQTVAFSHYNHLSAQLPLDPKTGQVVSGGIKAQARQCLHHIQAIVEGIDHVLSDVVSLTIFVRHIGDMAAVDEVYATFFSGYKPARTVVAVAALPQEALVQIEALLSNGEGTIPNAPQAGDLIKLPQHTDTAPSHPLSTQAVAFSHYNHLSAQLPLVPATGRVVVGGIKAQAAQCLNNVKAVLTSLDVPFDDIVKMTVFVQDLADIDAVNEVYQAFFPDSGIARTLGYVPARTVVVAEALPMGALVQMAAVVSHGDGTPPQAVEDRHGLIIEPHNTDQAPQCALSTQTVAFSHYNHLSAQLPLDPKTGQVVSGGIKAQAKQCFDHVAAIVASVGHSLADVVKVNVYLRHLEDAAAVDEVYADFFLGGVPARRTVGVSALPNEALVQIEVVVANAEGTPPQ
ncbi:MAG: reactive intermediate/imine deaminase [Neisseriaceae bacterium]|nr:reactive intermediate/imine deaminase [Neisseriaceae bacterium]